jgi:hypothetical protein
LDPKEPKVLRVVWDFKVPKVLKELKELKEQ